MIQCRVILFALLIPLFSFASGTTGISECAPVVSSNEAEPAPLSKHSFVYDVSAGTSPIGPGNRYEGQTYGDVLVQEAVQKHLPMKDFNDGTLDIFVSVRVADPDPSVDRGNIYAIVSQFGSKGREVRGMKRNPEAKRNVRIFVVGDRNQQGKKVPLELIELARDLSAEFGIATAINATFGRSSSWELFPAR